MMELEHYGVKGMKWGVRRFQNADGSLTAEGRKRYALERNVKRNAPYTNDVNSIVDSLTDKEKRLLGAELDEDWIDKKYEHDTLVNKAVTIVEKYGNTPVSFVEVWTNQGNVGQMALATKNDPKYRGKGYAQKAVDKTLKWVNQYGNKTISELEWYAEKTNTGSRHLAEKNGFVLDEKHTWDDYVRYYKQVK